MQVDAAGNEAYLLLHAAHREAPAVQARQVAQQRVNPLALARIGHARHNGQLPRHYLGTGKSSTSPND